MKAAKYLSLAACVLLLIILGQVSVGATAYKDVSVNHWAYKAITSLSETGIIACFSNQSFKPNQAVTREQFAIIIVKALKLPLDNKAPENFSDVKTTHRSFLYIDATKWFIPIPYNPKGTCIFNPEKALTREQVAEAMTLALNLKQNPKANAVMLSTMFKDYKNISFQSREQVALAVYHKIMSGKAKNLFDPKGTLTRAELSVIINGVLQSRQNQLNQQLLTNQKPLSPVVTQKPWTIKFIDFRPPDWDLVKSFLGTVVTKVYGPGDNYLVLEHRTTHTGGSSIHTTVKTVNMYVYEQDVQWFYTGDMIKLNYDRNNNITSYSFETEAKPHSYLPPVRR
jgi:hypothetical protein